MNRTVSIAIAVLFVIAIGGFIVFFTPNETNVPAPGSEAPAEAAPEENPVMVSPENPAAVNAYVTENLSELSTEPEVLGGTFYVTDISSANGAGVVSYEDGHNAYTADFTYSLDAAGNVTVNEFVVRPL